jgi:hypothetical protein
MSEREQQPPLDIEVLRWDAESFTVEGINLELENLRGQRIPRLILRHNGKIIFKIIQGYTSIKIIGIDTKKQNLDISKMSCMTRVTSKKFDIFLSKAITIYCST